MGSWLTATETLNVRPTAAGCAAQGETQESEHTIQTVLFPPSQSVSTELTEQQWLPEVVLDLPSDVVSLLLRVRQSDNSGQVADAGCSTLPHSLSAQPEFSDHRPHVLHACRRPDDNAQCF